MLRGTFRTTLQTFQNLGKHSAIARYQHVGVILQYGKAFVTGQI
jgi:hypothetical protein